MAGDAQRRLFGSEMGDENEACPPIAGRQQA
jgi:hypothetical protein